MQVNIPFVPWILWENHQRCKRRNFQCVWVHKWPSFTHMLAAVPIYFGPTRSGTTTGYEGNRKQDFFLVFILITVFKDQTCICISFTKKYHQSLALFNSCWLRNTLCNVANDYSLTIIESKDSWAHPPHVTHIPLEKLCCICSKIHSATFTHIFCFKVLQWLTITRLVFAFAYPFGLPPVAVTQL